MRKHTNNTLWILSLFEEVIQDLYRGGVAIKERLVGGEWTIIGSIGQQEEHPKIPLCHRATLKDPNDIQ
jgi:hypothetical protein